MLPLAALLLPTQAPAPAPALPEVDAKTLPGVPGPLTPMYPDPARDLGTDRMDMVIRTRARKGVNIPAVAVPAGSFVLLDQVPDASGWKAYRIEVPAGGSFKARLRSQHDAWFKVKVFNRWGRLEEGMFQNRIPTGNPEASYHNPKTTPSTVYIVVDTTETNLRGEKFKLTVAR